MCRQVMVRSLGMSGWSEGSLEGNNRIIEFGTRGDVATVVDMNNKQKCENEELRSSTHDTRSNRLKSTQKSYKMEKKVECSYKLS